MSFILFVILFIVYFLPWYLSGDKPQTNSVLVLNLFLGWTFIFWVIALCWAVMPDNTRKA